MIYKQFLKLHKKIAQAFKEKLGINNLNIIQSNGKDAQQDIFHYHVHILPRFKNDDTIIRFNQDINNSKRLENKFKKIEKIFEQ